MTTLAGIVPIRNGHELDYCWREAVLSLLEFSDEVVICDGESTDGTKQAIDAWATSEPRITPCTFLWTDPRGVGQEWWVTFLNYARQHAKSDWVFQLDGDECVHEESAQEIREAVEKKKPLICHRLNFWKDAQHTIPAGEGCGHEVIRLGPKDKWMPTDAPDPQGRDGWICEHAAPSKVKIGHYGFLRKPSAFFKKSKVVQKIWTNNIDRRLEEVEKLDGNWMDKVVPWNDRLEEYKGTHPKAILEWLKERGYGF
jgi:glycosyltransferase involved in cell wall biosynthesis